MPEMQDLAGKRFGKWTVIKRVGKTKCLCKCDCGTVKEQFVSNITGGKTLSCGCTRNLYYPGAKFGKLTILRKIQNKKSYPQYECQCDCGNTLIVAPNFFSKEEVCCYDCQTPKVEDISGQRFGRLTAIKYAGKSKGKQTLWECRCDCGNTVIVHQQNLKSGHTNSCGCYNSDIASESNKTHGESKLRIYTIWHDMLLRCYSDKHHSYYLYGGSGITVCAEWKNSYESFRDWSYANGYAENLSIDRIDYTGNYEPSNCRWATLLVQANNTSRNLYYTIDGITDTLANWCRKYNMPYMTVHSRVYALKWDILDALTKPINKSNKGRE